MKIKSMLIVCCLAGVAMTYSCNKKADTLPVPKPTNSEKAMIRIRLGGDIIVSESPLGDTRKAHNYVYARTLESRTIYAVYVRTSDAQPYAAGLFDNPDSIKIELPAGANYSIKAAAYKRGSGLGLWYQLTENGLMYFENPFYAVLNNQMAYSGIYVDFIKDFTYTYTFAQDTANKHAGFFPELDSYVGSVNVNADSSQTFVLPMRRIAFGIKYSAVNFTEGRLLVNYSGSMHDKYLTPQNIDSSLSIYTGNDFQYGESISSWERILFTLKWEKPDGSIQTLGGKEIYPPQRNYITTINITMPTSSTTSNNGVDIQITDTAWTSSTIINF